MLALEELRLSLRTHGADRLASNSKVRRPNPVDCLRQEDPCPERRRSRRSSEPVTDPVYIHAKLRARFRAAATNRKTVARVSSLVLGRIRSECDLGFVIELLELRSCLSALGEIPGELLQRVLGALGLPG